MSWSKKPPPRKQREDRWAMMAATLARRSEACSEQPNRGLIEWVWESIHDQDRLHPAEGASDEPDDRAAPARLRVRRPQPDHGVRRSEERRVGKEWRARRG